MGYNNLQECIRDLEAAGRLVRLDVEVDPYLEAGVIQRRVYQAGGPALLFTRVKGSRFPMLGNLFGTLDRARYLFRDTLPALEKLVRLKVDPGEAMRAPWKNLGLIRTLWNARPKFVSNGPILAGTCDLTDLPNQVSWPKDGGAFVTLPQVYSESPASPGWMHSNLGMYRVQFSGGQYAPNREVGLHYQIHRGIAVHHAQALERRQPLRVNVFIGGPPAMTLAAVMPLPEGMPEISFAGMLGGHRMELVPAANGLVMPAHADFCISGVIDDTKTLPEGPFGDHLGYYSLEHDFPVLRVDRVYHRPDAIWPFTTVGRPPQEDTSFGALIHELTGEAIPTVLPGVRAIHAVDAAGVHPLLLALGSERYVPYDPHKSPRELLTQANAILGQGQLSLAKYLFIANSGDDPALDIHDIPAFFRHVLQRVDWTRDLHFQTRTTVDTLDYSGLGLNEGSKVVIAAAGPPRRTLPTTLPRDMRLPDGFDVPTICLPGVLAVQGPPCVRNRHAQDPRMEDLCRELRDTGQFQEWPLILVVDDSAFTAASLNNFLWICFTRSDPGCDIYGVGASTICKHWGCTGPLVIDARSKPHHAPALEPDPEVEKRVDQLAARGGPLHRVI
ncbi:4-hydroxy-3-polyprenylbenzoate decarboxylase [Desulfonatronum thiosulfatophilum]|uniref:4-hydroxy-3-polyprenylbenzoate decarboxylase n=1 Tax=Desulfonatronum thiosulfatophilum TaxID=617002 RepID=A0A1G6CV22_9BACT|nr:UbiD family decarboxylase [Desulfonatronum thiosulfatophilum]SDB36674.1 4-hydroxy-3-polyprenylbenzoate decarboxylase [Desulfonatronum thiosulfatophilum]